MTVSVRDVLSGKGTHVWAVSPEDTILVVLQIMAKYRIGFVPVVQKGKIVGIYSERDFARLMAARNDVSLDLPVHEVMVHPVYFVRADQSLQECIEIMSAMHFRHLPVLENDELCGVISIGDAVKAMMDEKDFAIEHLENLLWANLV